MCVLSFISEQARPATSRGAPPVAVCCARRPRRTRLLAAVAKKGCFFVLTAILSC